MKKTLMRPAMSMIELVFAIVIIGISVVTIPVMLTQSSDAVMISTQQEAILVGSTKMNNILSHAWDINQTDSTRNGGYAKVINASNGDNELDVNATTFRRVGHFEGNKRRRGYNNIGATDASIDNTGVMHLGSHAGNNFELVDASGSGDYLREYETNTSVYFISDTANYSDVNLTFALNDADVGNANPTNIKFISMIVSSPDPNEDTRINLFSFSSNIGQTRILKREIYD